MKHLLLTHLSLNLHAVLTFFSLSSPYFSSLSLCLLNSVIFSNLSHSSGPFVLLTLCFVSLHPLLIASRGGFCCWVCVCCFGSHLFCCFVSVKCAADVDLISLNTLILLIERLWCCSQGTDGGYGPTSGSTYDIRFMVSKICKQTDFC